ncbi:MAG: diguanylate cyclase [Lachnospiraceae bacterium]|nr:diguanylate cyclase [Lachnospiraceae bacterium]
MKQGKKGKRKLFKEDMDLAKQEYRRYVLITAGGIVVSLFIILIIFYAVTRFSARLTYDAVLNMKKDMLKENVDNFISFMDAELNEKKGLDKDGEADYAYEVAYRKIYSESHDDGTYMWIQKVLDYNGGDDYAIRLIHPNLKDTEGTLLSTNVVNEMGMKAYEEELNGVKENGSTYLRYAFKKLNSDSVSEKITYSCLYKRLDWIVCMGVNIDDLEMYRKEAFEDLKIYQITLLFIVMMAWTLFFSIISYGYRKTKIGSYENKNKALMDKLEFDVLTGARSRVFGEALLEKSYDSFKAGERNILLLMLDVDYFKQFNDGYGHELGDKVLKKFVEAIHSVIRSEDAIIRWGGDEFVVVFKNVPREYQAETADRIINSIRNIRIEELEKDKKGITASMGFAYFEKDDPDAKTALSRADEALYRAKEAGRNNWKI